MTALFRNVRSRFLRHRADEKPSTVSPLDNPRREVATAPVDIAPDDPIIPYFQSVKGAVEIDKLNMQSPALRALQAAGVKMAVPLVSQGELIGVLNLGPRLSEQEYSADDRTLLNNLASQTAPALRVAQLVRQQEAEVRVRERIEHELRVARLIQQTLLPKELPALPGWNVAAFYEPARAVGGDFYDFLTLPGGRLGIVIGDVTDKGVPAALVMATTRSTIRATAQQLISPGLVLERVNDQLCPEIPPNMFVTCLYAVLNPVTGLLWYANAGHDMPYRRHQNGADELYARGMPLGLMEGMSYEEKETTLLPGEKVLLYSDGLVEAHNPQREMFGFPRLQALVAEHAGDGATLIDFLRGELARFTGADWEQEDDITLVTLQHTEASPLSFASPPIATAPSAEEQPSEITRDSAMRKLAEWTLASEPGNERVAMDQVADVVKVLDLPHRSLERLKTAVAEATLNAIEHGNSYQAELPVLISVSASENEVSVSIRDQGGAKTIPEPGTPDLEAKLAGLQTPRGWGLFLIKNLVDDMRVTSDSKHHTIELLLNRGEPKHAG